ALALDRFILYPPEVLPNVVPPTNSGPKPAPWRSPMLNLTIGAFRDCSGMTRRQFVGVGGLTMLGLTLPDLLTLRQRASAAGKSAKSSISCIFLWMRGGASHIDTFDPKPDAVEEIRGEFGTIPTTLPGVRITDQLPRLSRQTDRYSIIRGHLPMSES